MGLGETTQYNYLRISMGKVRKKCEPSHPKAVPWKDKDGKEHHDLVWTYVDGKLLDVKFRDHETYGKQWAIIVQGESETYNVQMPENSKAGVDLLKKLPNLVKGEYYRFTPWAKEVNGKTRGGLSIVRLADDQKVPSYYQVFTERDDNGFDVKNIHDFPDMTEKNPDKDDWKIYFTKVNKFLRTRALEHLRTGFLEGKTMGYTPSAAPVNPAPGVEEDQVPQDTNEPEFAAPEDDDLPF